MIVCLGFLWRVTGSEGQGRHGLNWMGPPRLHHPAPAFFPEGHPPDLSTMLHAAFDDCLSHTLDYFKTYVNMTYRMVS